MDICDKEKNQDNCNKDCNMCLKNAEILQNIAVIRSCLKLSRAFMNQKENSEKTEQALKWVDNYLLKQ